MTPARKIYPAACLLYAGMLLGVSFIATPAKFLARGVVRGDLLLVGRATFGVFGWVEAVFVGVLLVSARLGRVPIRLALITALIAGIQHLALRPILDARLEMIVNQQSVAPACWHHAYGVLEAAKLALLLIMGLGWINRQAPPNQIEQAEPDTSRGSMRA